MMEITKTYYNPKYTPQEHKEYTREPHGQNAQF